MTRFYQRTATGIGRAVEIEHIEGGVVASVAMMDETRTIQCRLDADALESVANGLQIAARRLREAGNNG